MHLAANHCCLHTPCDVLVAVKNACMDVRPQQAEHHGPLQHPGYLDL